MARGCVFQPSYTVTLPDGTKERRKSKTFWIQYKDGQGIKRREPVSEEKKDADEALDVANTRAIKDRAGLPTQSAATLPLAELIKTYLDALGPSVCAAHLESLKHRLEAVAIKTRAVTVRDLTPEKVEAFLMEFADGVKKGDEIIKPSARTINTYLQAVRSMLTWAVKRRKLTHNPLDCITPRPETEKRHARRALSEDELSQLLAAALEGPARRAAKSYKTGTIPLERQAELAEQGRRNALIYRLLVLTGLRVNEARLLTWADMDLDAGTLTTRPEWQGNKSGRAETLPLAPALVELLKGWRTRHPADDAAPVVRLPQGFVRTLDSDLEAAGIAKRDASNRVLDLHALRHTHGSRLVASGADIKTVQALMRHATPALTLGVYVHRDKGRMAEAVAGLPDVKPAPRPGPEAEAVALKTGTDNTPLDAETNPKVENFGAREVQGTGRRNTQDKAVSIVKHPTSAAFQASYAGPIPATRST